MADDTQQYRMAQYKKRGEKSDQVARRRQILEDQKQRRYDYLNHVRMIAEVAEDGEDATEAVPESQEMEVQTSPTEKQGKKRYRRRRPLLENQLMHSEWMTSIPEDLEAEWMLLPCPKGKRCLVIASGGTTTAYSKRGYVVSSFPSHLPGGHGRYAQRGRDCTIMDTILNESLKTIYILDLMCWKDHPVYDSETEFRFYWLHTKLQDVPLCFEKAKVNPYKFVPLPNYSCDRSNITSVMATPMDYELDGLLFYHKRAHYNFGQCPLVLWLKPYMLPDLFGIPVPDLHMQQMPVEYQGFQHFIEEMEKNRQANLERKEKGTCGVSKKKQQQQQQKQPNEPQVTDMQTAPSVSNGMIQQNADPATASQNTELVSGVTLMPNTATDKSAGGDMETDTGQ